MTVEGLEGNNKNFGPWMLVERKSRRKSRDLRASGSRFKDKNQEGPRFRSLAKMEGNVEENPELISKDLGFRRKKGKESLPVGATETQKMGKLKEQLKQVNSDLGIKNLAKPNQFNKKGGGLTYRPIGLKSGMGIHLDAGPSMSNIQSGPSSFVRPSLSNGQNLAGFTGQNATLLDGRLQVGDEWLAVGAAHSN